jgi:hypothetical protein
MHNRPGCKSIGVRLLILPSLLLFSCGDSGSSDSPSRTDVPELETGGGTLIVQDQYPTPEAELRPENREAQLLNNTRFIGVGMTINEVQELMGTEFKKLSARTVEGKSELDYEWTISAQWKYRVLFVGGHVMTARRYQYSRAP